jgi:hypothetical protein
MLSTAYICLRPGCYCVINITNTPSDVILAGLEEAACRVALEAEELSTVLQGRSYVKSRNHICIQEALSWLKLKMT